MTFFDAVIGQDKIKSQLTDLVNRGTLPHSLLFYGEPGLGKLGMAIGLASLLLGRQVFSPDEGQSFLQQVEAARIDGGESEARVKAEGLPLYTDRGEAFWLRPVKTTLKVEQWYTLLRDYLTLSGSGRRVVIVEDFHTANAVMANAMLKTIEEPPEGVSFIIITAKRATVLPTIISRCMTVGFTEVDQDIILDHLRRQGLTGDLEGAAAAGRGNPAMTLSLLEQGELPLLAKAAQLLKIIVTDQRAFTLGSLLSEPLSREEMTELFHWMRVLSRDMMAIRYGSDIQLLQCPAYRDRLLQIMDKWSPSALEVVFCETLAGDEALRLHVKAALVMDGVLISLSQAVKEEIH